MSEFLSTAEVRELADEIRAMYLRFARGVMFYCGSAALVVIGYFAGWLLP